MRNAKLTILAALSLVVLAVLAFGYIGHLGLSVVDVSAVTATGETGRNLFVSLRQGQFGVGWSNWISRPMPYLPGPHIYPSYHFKPQPLRWGFENNRYTNITGYRGDALFCPLWFAALPFTIAPIAWLRRRRRREPRGFAVEGSQPVSEHVELQTDRQTPTGV